MVPLVRSDVEHNWKQEMELVEDLFHEFLNARCRISSGRLQLLLLQNVSHLMDFTCDPSFPANSLDGFPLTTKTIIQMLTALAERNPLEFLQTSAKKQPPHLETSIRTFLVSLSHKIIASGGGRHAAVSHMLINVTELIRNVALYANIDVRGDLITLLAHSSVANQSTLSILGILLAILGQNDYHKYAMIVQNVLKRSIKGPILTTINEGHVSSTDQSEPYTGMFRVPRPLKASSRAVIFTQVRIPRKLSVNHLLLPNILKDYLTFIE